MIKIIIFKFLYNILVQNFKLVLKVKDLRHDKTPFCTFYAIRLIRRLKIIILRKLIFVSLFSFLFHPKKEWQQWLFPALALSWVILAHRLSCNSLLYNLIYWDLFVWEARKRDELDVFMLLRRSRYRPWVIINNSIFKYFHRNKYSFKVI